MKIRQLIENNKDKILFNGGSMLPSDKNCTVCSCFKASCNGLLYEGKCPLNIQNSEDMDSLYYLLEELQFNNFTLAKCFGIDISSQEITESISLIEDACEKSLNEEFKSKAKQTLDRYYSACNSNIDINELLEKDIKILFHYDENFIKY